jgi:glycosyl transferase, family 25
LPSLVSKPISFRALLKLGEAAIASPMKHQPPIYVINMAKDVARMVSMQQQLQAQGLSFERVEAVVGRELTVEQKKASFSSFWYGLLQGRAATNNEIGCTLSHRKIWQLMIDRGDQWAVIFEDDALLLPQFSGQLLAIEKETQYFDMMHLFAFREPNIFHHKSSDGLFDVMKYSGPHGSTAAYALRLVGAKKLMTMKRVWTAPDKWTWLSAITGLKCCGISPYPVLLEEELAAVSTIASAQGVARRNNRLWLIFVLPILRLLRKSIMEVRGL